MEKQVVWVAFAKETNTTQRAKYQHRVKLALGAIKSKKKLGGLGGKIKKERNLTSDLDSKITKINIDSYQPCLL
jgi:hypothetical protein